MENSVESQPVESKKRSPVTTGRRKESVARVHMVPGSGKITVNKRALEDYFPRQALQIRAQAPLSVAHAAGSYDVKANVEGGGLAGQADAIRLGIARALAATDEALRRALRGAGMLTRDGRMKERKKYGKKGARKRFQWTKR